MYTSLKAAKNLFDQLNKTLMFSKMEFFHKNPIGRIISRISSDLWSID